MKKPETKFRGEVIDLIRDYGGRPEHLILDGKIGFPDLTAFFPDAITGFIECKMPGGRLAPHQRRWLNILQHFGHPVGAYDKIEDVERFLRRILE